MRKGDITGPLIFALELEAELERDQDEQSDRGRRCCFDQMTFMHMYYTRILHLSTYMYLLKRDEKKTRFVMSVTDSP